MRKVEIENFIMNNFKSRIALSNKLSVKTHLLIGRTVKYWIKSYNRSSEDTLQHNTD